MPIYSKELHLSDAFDRPTEPGKFEWTATLININSGMNSDLLAKCNVLKGYILKQTSQGGQKYGVD